MVNSRIQRGEIDNPWSRETWNFDMNWPENPGPDELEIMERKGLEIGRFKDLRGMKEGWKSELR